MAENLEHPLMSLYGTEWSGRGYGQRLEGSWLWTQNGGSVAMNSEWSGYGLKMEGEWLWILTGMSLH
jgi:hypothetical protein